MKTCCITLFIAASLLTAQVQRSDSKASAEIKPDTVVAEMNGKKLTAAEFQELITIMPPDVRATAMRDPENFFKQYAHFRRILDMAEQEHFPDKSPMKERLIEIRRQSIVNARIDQVRDTVSVTPEEQKAYYQSHIADYNAARVKLIALAFAPPGSPNKANLQSEDEVRTKALGLVQQARAGADFAKLVRDYSQDPVSKEMGGEYPRPIRANSSEVPALLRKPILAMKTGEVSDPIRVDQGYYIIKAISVNPLPYDQVKDEVYQAMKQAAVDKFLEQTKKESSFKIDNPDFFKSVK